MSITPQAIKDQEFQSKFRGYDTIEVKAYLELLAEEFFELLEESRKHDEERELLIEERDALQLQNENFMVEIDSLKEEAETLRSEMDAEREKSSEVGAEMEELQTVIADHAQERGELEEEVSEAEAKIKDLQEMVENERREKETLTSRVKVLEERNEELKKEEVEFKSTLSAAQKFAQEIKDKSEEEARNIMTKAEEDVQNFRKAATEEMARIPDEIEQLHHERRQVRSELKEILQTYLKGLDSFVQVEEDEKSSELNDLFQKVEIGDDGSIASDDLAKINMDLDLPASLLEPDEDEDDLPPALDGIN